MTRLVTGRVLHQWTAGRPLHEAGLGLFNGAPLSLLMGLYVIAFSCVTLLWLLS